MRALLPRLLAGLLCCVAAATTVWAHTVPQSHLDLQVETTQIAITLDAPASGYGPDLPAVRFATPAEISQSSNDLTRLMLTRLSLHANGGVSLPVTGASTDAEVVPGGAPNDAKIRLHLTAAMPAGTTVKTLILQGALFPIDPQHKTVVTVRDTQGNLHYESILSAEAPTLTASLTGNDGGQSPFVVFGTFVKEGIHHIAIGPDHILFIVGLLLMGGGLGRLLKVVTAFTVAHSITLALAALGIVHLSPLLVEPTIAASIVFVGLRVLAKAGSVDVPVREERLFYAFGFGLVHGFGFAGALSEMGLPRHALAVSLVGFNVGVEIGQAAIVLAVAPLLALLWRRYPVVALAIVRIAAAIVIAAGAYWFGQRIAG